MKDVALLLENLPPCVADQTREYLRYLAYPSDHPTKDPNSPEYLYEGVPDSAAYPGDLLAQALQDRIDNLPAKSRIPGRIVMAAVSRGGALEEVRKHFQAGGKGAGCGIESCVDVVSSILDSVWFRRNAKRCRRSPGDCHPPHLLFDSAEALRRARFGNELRRAFNMSFDFGDLRQNDPLSMRLEFHESGDLSSTGIGTLQMTEDATTMQRHLRVARCAYVSRGHGLYVAIHRDWYRDVVKRRLTGFDKPLTLAAVPVCWLPEVQCWVYKARWLHRSTDEWQLKDGVIAQHCPEGRDRFLSTFSVYHETDVGKACRSARRKFQNRQSREILKVADMAARGQSAFGPTADFVPDLSSRASFRDFFTVPAPGVDYDDAGWPRAPRVACRAERGVAPNGTHVDRGLPGLPGGSIAASVDNKSRVPPPEPRQETAVCPLSGHVARESSRIFRASVHVNRREQHIGAFTKAVPGLYEAGAGRGDRQLMRRCPEILSSNPLSMTFDHSFRSEEEGDDV